jgi:hypothetical protein
MICKAKATILSELVNVQIFQTANVDEDESGGP